jgi:hypothetical protein
MDCDQVFIILTRGPFPTGEPWDEDVEAHLEYCGDCWRLAEALRPALEVFQEAVPPAEGRDLPGYWGDARPASLAVGDLIRGSARTVLAAQPKAVPATDRRRNLTQTIADELSADVVRAMAIAATMTLAALALVSLL